jgi:hypothetical protein
VSDADPDASDGLVDAAIDAPGYLAWGAPMLLASLESNGTAETDPSITADKLTVVFSADLPAGDAQLFIAKRTALTDTFTVSELTELNVAGASDHSPEISPDGRSIFFTSNRSGAYEVYSSVFTTAWAQPTLRNDLSTAGLDDEVAVSPDRLTAVVAIDGTPNRLRVSTRSAPGAQFGVSVLHAELEVTTDIGAPTITNGGEIIYFHAGSPRQLYRATKKGNGSYTNPAPVSELNVAGARCAAPFVLEGDEYMIFERDSNLYETTRALP